MADDEERLAPRRAPDWFLTRIAAGIEAADLTFAAPSPRRRMSRSEIDDLVTETLREELSRLPIAEPAEPEPE